MILLFLLIITNNDRVPVKIYRDKDNCINEVFIDPKTMKRDTIPSSGPVVTVWPIIQKQ